MNRDNNGFGAFLMGAVVGAAAVFFSDERNQKRLKATVNDWKSKADDAKETLQDKAENLREEGLKKVSSELEKTQAKVDSQRTKRR